MLRETRLGLARARRQAETKRADGQPVRALRLEEAQARNDAGPWIEYPRHAAWTLSATDAPRQSPVDPITEIGRAVFPGIDFLRINRRERASRIEAARANCGGRKGHEIGHLHQRQLGRRQSAAPGADDARDLAVLGDLR